MNGQVTQKQLGQTVNLSTGELGIIIGVGRDVMNGDQCVYLIAVCGSPADYRWISAGDVA